MPKKPEKNNNRKVIIPKHIKNILFDMDDVLVLTRVIDKEVKKVLFVPLGLNWSQIFPYTHLSLREMIQKMFEELKINESPDKYIKDYFLRYDKVLAQKAKKNTVPGATELIKRLLKKKYNLALVTSSTINQAKIVCRELGLDGDFKALITADDITHSKPHPEPYQKAMERLNANAAECAVIEDLPTGIMSAKNASKEIFVIAITTTNSAENLEEADVVINSFKEIEI